MEYARLETARLRDIERREYYDPQWCQCGHGARLSVTKLIARLGDEYPLAKVRERLRCENCRSRAVVITFLTPNQRTRSLVDSFTRKPGD